MTGSPADLTLAEAGRALRSGDLNAVDLLDAVLTAPPAPRHNSTAISASTTTGRGAPQSSGPDAGGG